jgi:hypothetical protein
MRHQTGLNSPDADRTVGELTVRSTIGARISSTRLATRTLLWATASARRRTVDADSLTGHERVAP